MSARQINSLSLQIRASRNHLSTVTNMSSRSNRVATTYNDPRTCENVQVQAIPYSDVDNVRNTQLDLQRRPQDRGDLVRSDFTSKHLQDYDNYATRRRVTRERYVDDHDRPPRRERRNSSRSTNSSPPRTRSRPRSRDRRNGRDRRARSLSADGRSAERSTEDFFDRHFDKSFDGIAATVAGAGIGAITARRFGSGNPHRPGERNHWRTVGGSVAGAAIGNAAEKRWRRYVDEKDEATR